MTAVLYGAIGGSSASQLYVIDYTNATTSTVGSIGYAVSGMAQHPGTNVMYGWTSRQSPLHVTSLISINLTTGAGTFIGSSAIQMNDVAFRADGTLFGHSPNGTGKLYTVNLATGVPTAVGSPTLFQQGGLAFDHGGVLWLVTDGALYTVNPATGVFTNTGIFMFNNPGFGVTAASEQPTPSGMWIAFNGRPSYLSTVDLTSGAVSTIGTLPNDFDAIAWTGTGGPPPTRPFPRLTFDGGPVFSVQ